MPEPPYGEISDLLKEGQVIPFLGAGVNLGHREPPHADWDAASSAFLPKGWELSRFLAGKCNFPSDKDQDLNDLAKVSSYFVEAIKRKRLRERLRGIFDRAYAPCKIHTYLAGVRTPLLVVTTNYDDLTEQAFRAAGKPFDLVVHQTDRKDMEASVLWWRHGETKPSLVPPNRLYIDLRTTTVIYKMHGTVARDDPRWDNYVITEEDYVDFLSRMTAHMAIPSLFMRHFSPRYFLFLGYGLQDWNLRVILRSLSDVLPEDEDANPAADGTAAEEEADRESQSWAVQLKPSPFEVKLWEARHVDIYDVDINEFVRRLEEQG